VDVQSVWKSIDALVIKTIIAGIPHLEASIAACMCDVGDEHIPHVSIVNNVRCFELLGFDVLLNRQLQAVCSLSF